MQSELHKIDHQRETIDDLKMYANHLQEKLNNSMASKTSMVSDAFTETDDYSEEMGQEEKPMIESIKMNAKVYFREFS